MKKIIYFFLFLILPISANAQTGWAWQNPLPQGNELTSITSYNLLMFAVGRGGAIIKSTNNGINWQNLLTNNFDTYKKVYFINQNVGFIIRNDNTIFRTNNSGTSWDSIYSPNISVRSLCFKNANTGIIIGDPPDI